MARRKGRESRRDPRNERWWDRLIREQEKSGESIRGFCRRKGVEEGSFYAWRRELRLRRREAEAASLSCMAAVEIQMHPNDNPMKNFPKVKGPTKNVPLFLTEEEVKELLATPRVDTVLGLRDRAILTLFVGTGIRASECATMKDRDVYLHPEEGWIKVTGKGGDDRLLPLNERVVDAMADYEKARGQVSGDMPFFRSRNGGGMSRNAMYERVRTNARRAGIRTRVYPHRLRHTFAHLLAKVETSVQEIRELLGHRCVSSTNIYMRTTGKMLRRAVNLIGIKRVCAPLPEGIIPNVRMPFQLAPQAF
jgi:integrase